MDKKYTVSTVKEMVDQIPVEKIDDFLMDFGTWFKFVKTGKSDAPEFDNLVKGIEEFIGAVGMLTGEPLPKELIDTTKFTWIDDNKHDKIIRIKGGDQEIAFTVSDKKDTP